MAGIILGVILVALSVEHQEAREFSYDRRHIRVTAAIGVATALIFAVTILAAQAAITRYGEVQTVWITRVVSLSLLGVMFAVGREAPVLPRSWLPVIGAQGMLDVGAYLALLLGSTGGNQIVVVVGSSFSAITVLLARVFLGERLRPAQWVGVAVILVGVAILSSQGAWG
jgi:drug/metabolite transporter (DMT)-like permease